VLILSALSISYHSNSQTKELDSLKNIDFTGKSDSVKLAVANLLAVRSVNPDSSLKYSLKLLDLTKDRNDHWRLLAYQSVGSAYHDVGDHEKAVESYFKALKIARKESHTSEAMVTINIADTYKAIENYNRAKVYYHSAIDAFLKSGLPKRLDSIYLAAVYTNLGDLHIIREKYDSALNYFNRAEYWAEATDMNSYLAIIRGNRAICLANLGQETNAGIEILKAINYLETNKQWATAVEFLQYMIDIYKERGEYDKAIEYGKKGLELALQHGYKKEIKNLSKRLYEIKKLEKDPVAALKYHELYVVYRDSILNRETLQKIADQRTKFEVGQKQTEVDLLTAEKKTQRILLIAIGGGTILIVMVLGLVYKNNRNKTRINKILEDQKQQLEELNSTKDKFFSIISHDLRGPVSAFSGISRLIKHSAQNKDHEGLTELSEHIDQTVDHLSGLLDNLLNWAMQQQGHFPHVPEKLQLKELLDEIQGIFKNMADGKNIAVNVNVNEDTMLWADKNTALTILRNLINNSLKFTSEGGTITISQERINDMIAIKISDNGIGIPEEKLRSLFKMTDNKSAYGTAGEKGLGLGLQLVYEFVELNNGKIEVDSEEGKGTKFTILLPLFEEEMQTITKS